MQNPVRSPRAFALLLTLAALPLTLAMTGCGGGGGGGGSSSNNPSLIAAGPLSASAAAPGGLTAALAQSVSGGSANYTLTLTNGTSQPITYTPESGVVPSGSNAFAVGGGVVIISPSGAAVYPPRPAGR